MNLINANDHSIDENTRLEFTAEKYAADLFKAADNNRVHLAQFLPWVPFMQSVEDMRKYLKNCELLFEQGQEISFIIITNESVVGRIGLNHIDRVNKNASIGYWIIKNEVGKGIISKSCEKLISYGFINLGLQRIEIRAATANLKSQAIPERFCFSKEGILRQAELVNHQFLDLVVYSILKEEWEKRKVF